MSIAGKEQAACDYLCDITGSLVRIMINLLSIGRCRM